MTASPKQSHFSVFHCPLRVSTSSAVLSGSVASWQVSSVFLVRAHYAGQTERHPLTNNRR